MTAMAATHVPHVPRRALIAIGVLAAAALAATASGLVQTPDLDKALTDLSDRLGAWTYLLVAALAFLETGAFVGLVAPGETAVILGGVVAAKGQVSLEAMLVIAWAAAALGDFVSFTLGGRLGRRFMLSHGPRLGITAPRLVRVEQFFDRHGAKAILAGRFVGLVRAVAPFLAGASGMRLRAFLPWSLLGTAVWSATFVLVGYAFSSSFGTAAGAITHGALALAVVGVAALLVRARVTARRAAAA
jgi:membrane protein DedA with SNARE-associated domain